MSDRHNWSRLVASIFVLTVISAVTFAAFAPKSFTSLLFAAEASSPEATIQPPAPLTQAGGLVVIGTCDTAGPIEVESSGGTTTPTAYPTLNDAFVAIIAGTHTGSINIEVCGNTTETASATLTASGVGATSYTDITIRPVGGARIIEGTITGAIIRLNGADNVTIDGRPGGAGTARDLTVRNNSTLTATAAVWLSSVAAGNGASGNTVRNLEIATGIDATSSSTSATFGIIMSGTTISVTANGVDNDNNAFIANRIVKARYGIVTRGTTTDLNVNPIVTDNIIGPNSFGSDQIGKVGIFMQADTGALVSRNTVQNVGCLEPQACTGADRMGIAIGNESWSTSPGTITSNTYTVTKNIVRDIVEETTFSCVGINLATTGGGSATNNLVANNFIYNVRANGTGGDMAVGLGIAGGHTDTVTFNSIAMTGDVDPGAAAASTNYGSGIRVANANGTTHLNLSLTNNSVYMDLSSSSGPTVRYYAISGSAAAYSFGTGGENFNNYYINPANPQSQTGGLGTASGVALTTQFATLANWQTAYTAPQDANSIQADPLYFSNTSDPHIQTSSPNVNAGVAVAGITDDIDSQVRPNGANPDIGADEFYPSAGSIQLTSSTYSVTEVAAVVVITATRSGGANGAVSVDYATVAGGTATGGGSCSGGTDYVNASGTLMWADLDIASKTFMITVCNDGAPEPAETVNLAITNPTGGVTLGTPNTAVLTILNSTAFGGSVSVGTGETVTSLTNPGGLFEQINNGSLTSNLTVNITSDLTAETGTVALIPWAGGFTLTIQPSGGAARLIAGANATALLDFNGADGVTIDGLNTGGNSLNIRSTGTGSAVRFINDASGNTVTRTTLEANTTGSVIFVSTGMVTGNDNNSIVGNVITGRSDAAGAPFNSINLIGSSAAISNTDTLINNNQIVNFTQAGIVVANSDNVTFTNNDISQTVSRTTSLFGVAVNSAGGTNTFSGNSVHDLTTTLATTGMQFNDARDTTVTRNRIYNFPSTTGSTGALTGIVFNGASGTAATVTISNNMVSLIPGFTNAQALLGIRDFGFAGNTFNSYYNTVLLSGTGTGATNTYACVRGTSAPTAYTSINNICFNNRTGGTGNHFAAGDQSSNTGTFVSNYNIFVGTGATAANFFDKATSSTAVPVDFAGWQTGPPARDANSQASNPGVGNYSVGNMFVSTTDLHLANEGMNPASNAGTPVMGITTDFDGNTRSSMSPEIGFDEFFVATPGTLAFSSATYTVSEAIATITLTVNRTGGSDGAVSVDYTLAGGTATGGASCGGSVDYVNTGGTLMFANGETSKTFDVAICNDAVFEGDETFNATLSNATGGATIGTPNPAAVTITDNKGQPTVQFSSATYTITEGLADSGVNPVATITVTLSGASQAATSVNYATVAGGTATGGASCGGGVDYINTSGTLNFVAGDVSETFTVTTCPDATDESDETVNMALSSPVGVTLGTPNTAVLTIVDNDGPPSSPVTVTATAGTTGPTPYNTVKEAFDAINAGTHQGAINIAINSNTTETASAILDASGGTASYTSVLIRPTATATVSGSVVGAIIKLNGADNVTIDGRIGGTGTGRDLTIRNNSATTATAAIWLSSTGAGAGATGNTIRNLEIAAGQTADTGALATFGIMMSGAAITVTSDGNDNDNNSFIANRVTRARYGIVTRGVAANNNEGLVITDNIIGPDTFGPNEIGKAGLFLQGDTGAVVSRNTVQYVGGTFATTTAGADRCGICIGGENWGQTEAGVFQSGDYNVTKNIVHDVIDERTFAAAGIRIGTTRLGMPTNNLVANNFVYNIRTNGTAGDQAVGIGYAAGHTDRIVFNSIAMTGDMDPAGTTNGSIYGNAMRVSTVNGTNNANLTMQNNSIFMDVNSNTATVHFYAITLPVATYSFGTGGLNYNNYYVNQANPQMRTGGIGTTSGATPGAEFQTLANWQTALTPPQDANSIQADPLYFSNTFDLHIQPASPNINVGTTIAGITDDIDAQVRPNGANPDIGADEFYPAGGSVRLSSSSYSVSETGGTVTVTVLRLGGANGAASVDFTTGGGTATGGASCTAGVDYVSASGTLNWADLDATPKTVMIQICADGVVEGIENFNVTLSNPTTVTLGSPSSAVVNILDAGSTVTGTINVGSGEAITSLTNPGGIFDVINNGTVTGNTTINITSDLAGETGAIQLNEFASPFTITIKPVGAARTVSGTSSATTGLVGFNAADRVTIDGSLSGGSDRSLTVQSNNTATTGGGIYFASVGTNGATDNTIKNVNVWGGGATTGTLLGITFASNSFGALGSNHDNNRIENNDIRGTFYGIAVLGESAANQNTGTVITKNVMPATGTGGIGRIGVYLFNDDGAQITENTIASVSSATAVDCIGLAIGNQNITLNPAVGEITNATIARNSIGVVSNTVTNSSVGIVLASGATGTNNVVNNMVTGVIGNADVVSAATNDVVAGILIIPRAGATQNVYHNSVSMTGNRGTTNNQAPSFALAITADQPTNVVNNILVNSQTRGGTGGGGESYAIGFDGPAANANLTSNFNDLFVSGAQGQVGITGDLTTAAQTPTAGTGTNQTTLAAWQAATTEDANSFSVDPLFVSTTDLHLQAMSPMINAGTNVGVTNDFDGQTRVPPVDIGADEIPAGPSPGVLAFSSATYNVSEAGPTVTLTVNRTGGSTGAVTVDYTLGGGTATGGSTCGGSVDYDNDGGTLMFADGETSKMFNVPICEDVAVEANETFNATLSNATGGATIGMPNPATVTIIDNDSAPAMFNVAISDARVTEGNTGTVNMTFNVTLTAVMPPLTEGGAVASVQYATANGTATAGSDYGATMGTLNFNTTGTQTVTVVVSGDTTKESNEFLFVNLSNPSANTTITDSQGAGIIVDEDRPYVADFDRDIKSDFSVFRPSTAVWYVLQSSNSTPKIGSAGPSGDVAVPGDYDADGKADFAVFQNSSGNWSVLRSSDSVITTTNWGITGDKPVQGDYDGDGKTDFAVFRPSSGQWWILRSATSTSITVTFGISTDKLVQGEYDGDFKTDIAVYRNGTWFVLRSSDGSVSINNWGNASDRPVSGDFDGDGRNDLAVYRSGVWWILNSLSGTFNIVPFGLGSDVPAAADYDGDGTTDRAVFRGSTGDWYVLRSSDSTLTGVVWGVSTDVPVPTAYIPQ